MQRETRAPAGEAGAENEPSIDSICEFSVEEKINIALRALAESEPSEIGAEQKLKELSRLHDIGLKPLRVTYIKIQAAFVQEQLAANSSKAAPTPEEIEAEKLAQIEQEKADRLAQEEQAMIASKVKTLQAKSDLLPVFHDALTKAGYVCDTLIAASLWFSHGSRYLTHSSAFIFTGASGSGKSDGIVKASQFLPPEAVLSLTSVSERALNYLGDLRHQYVIFGEISPHKDGEDDPRQMAFRQLISENKITHMTVQKSATGQMEAELKVTEGPCVCVASTTREPNKFNDELSNRASWVVSNDSKEVTAKVLEAIAAKAENPVQADDAELALTVKTFQEFHRTLKPLPVTIPFAGRIKPTSKHVTVRRLSKLILSYVQASALLHQHCRVRQVVNGQEVVVAAVQDYELAYKVIAATAPRVLELSPPQARKAFDEKLKPALTAKSMLSTGQIQQILSQPDSTVRRWLKDFTDAGLLLCVRPGNQQNIFSLNPEAAEHFTQELGLVHPSVLFDTPSANMLGIEKKGGGANVVA